MTQPHNNATDSRAETVLILDFGSQYAQLIARRVREAGVYSLLVRPDAPIAELLAHHPVGIILSGGPSSVSEATAPRCDPELFTSGVPILGICYGMQLTCQTLGGRVDRVATREYGRANVSVVDDQDLMMGVPANATVWMSHGDQVVGLPTGFDVLASTPTCPFAAVGDLHTPAA